MAHSIGDIQAAGGFEIIHADPAWRYTDRGSNGAAEQHYKPDAVTERATMSLEEIQAMPVAQIAAPNAALFLWGTWPLLLDVIQVIPSWGFKYKTLAFLWVKYSERLIPFFGTGHYTRGNTEFCLLATRGKPKVLDHGVHQLIETLFDPEREVLTGPREVITEGPNAGKKHSRKPAAAREKIDRLFGPNPLRVELFAREPWIGGDVWGNEVDSTITFK